MSLQLKSPRIVQNRNSGNRDKYSNKDLARRSILETLISYFKSGYLEEHILIHSLQSLFPNVGKHKIQQLMPQIRTLSYTTDEELIDIIWDELYEY